MIHSCSKYIGGHSDIVAGAVIGKAALVDQIFEHGHQALGAVNSPFNSWLALRGIRTMPVRLAHQSQAIQTVLSAFAKGSANQPLISSFCRKSTTTSVSRKKYLTGYGSLFAIDLKDTDF